MPAIHGVRDDGSMAQQARSGDATETDQLVQQAIDELYSIEPDEFMARRADLVAAAKAAKDREATKRITALRKPTRSAFAINRMVRREPEALDGLLELGDELRAAERSVDAPRVRELSKQRRRLIDDVARRALEEDDPTAVRDEVVSTLQAALADEDVAEQVRSGSLVRAATFEGFGFPGAPDLSVVRSARTAPSDARPDRLASRAAVPESPEAPGRDGTAASERSAGTDAAPPPEPGEEVEHESAADRRQREREEREQERARRTAQDEAMAALERAEDAATAATRRERDLRKRIRELEDELYEVRRELDDARAEVKRTAAEQREARLTVDRLD